MALGGTRKAALLLMALDSQAAAELLKSLRPETVTEIAAELASINSAASSAADISSTFREFFGVVSGSAVTPTRSGEFLKQVLENAVGKNRSQEILGQVQQLLANRDPFAPIRSASVEEIAQALAGESGQVAALVLCELPGKASAQLLPLLADDVRGDAIRGMTAGADVPQEAKVKVANFIQQRLDEQARKNKQSGVAVGVSPQARRTEQLRRVAVLLRGLELALRDSLLKSIAQQDAATGSMVQKLMVTWEDMPLVADRTLQNVLRSVDGRKLALSLVKASAVIDRKFRSSISERAAAMLDEEASLLNNPKDEDIQAARESILDACREINSRGELPLEAK